MSFVRDNMAPLMFGGMVLFMLIGYPAAFSLAATGLFFGFIGIEFGLIAPDFLGNLTYQLFGDRLQRPAAGDSVLHVHGRDSGALRARRGSARLDRPVVRSSAWRLVLRGDFRRRHPRRDHRHGRRLGHRHGRDLDAADDQIRLLDASHHGRHRRVGHDHSAHTALARADRARRPARPLGRRHVCGRHRAEHHSGRAVLHLGVHRQRRVAQGRARAAARGAHPAGLDAVAQMPARHDAVARPDLPRARHDLHGSCNPDRGGRDGRGRRDRARRVSAAR